MKQKRHNTILSLISSKIIETQKELTDELNALGFKVTQATVSRDIKDLQIMKRQTGDGRYRYTQGTDISPIKGGARIKTIFSNSVVNIDSALNQIIIKTLSGMAQAAAITIEGMERPEVLGTIAGDDTVLVVTKSEKEAKVLAESLKELI
ncbi:MAG: arginine repressor [Clostridia bacterium]|nr:arginine repressor [Clostridia bacterium]